MSDIANLMENEVFRAFASYATIILSKMMFMSIATAFYRLTRKSAIFLFGISLLNAVYFGLLKWIIFPILLSSLAETFFEKARRVFVNPEDCASFGKGENAKKFLRTDDRVERVRRAHLNDLENIVPFLGIGLLYSLSGPDPFTAILHFRIFVGARIYHTISYLLPLPQPNRALSFFAGFGVTLSMAYSLLRNRLYL